MNHSRNEALISAAEALQMELSKIPQTDLVLRETHKLLAPLVERSIKGNHAKLPPELPKRDFFFGMHDHCLAGGHLELIDLINAIGAFGDALRFRTRGNS